MKILYIITQGELGGAQRYVLDLAREFSNDNDVIVANGKGGNQWLAEGLELQNSINNKKIISHKFNYLVREINPIKDLLAFFEIKKYIKEIKPDIIHVNSTKAGVLVAFVKGNVSSVYTVHGWVFNEPMNWLKKQLYIFIEKMSCRRHNKIILLGEHDKQIALLKKIVSEKKLVIIPHGINLITFSSRQKNDTAIINLVAIANFYKTKGLDYLIKAVNQMDNVRLTIYGDGPEKQKLESLITDKEKIELKGRTNDARLALPAFDIFILPSLKEGFPYVILEAMNAGLPIVATTVGEIPNILENEKTALIVKPANFEALTVAIQKLIDNPTLRATLSANAQKRLADFSFETMIKKHEQLYKTLAPRNK